jgi:tRNA threonylcarbamoyladenosine biosynthesis protein TsaE
MRAKLAVSSQNEMADFAQKLTTTIKVGDILLLDGPLGAGKTFLAQQVMKSLGVTEPVTSPTFVMVKSYRGKLPINHIDAYRLLDLPNPRQAFDELDIELDSAVTIVEWGGGFDEGGDALYITIEIDVGEKRTLIIEGPDSRWGGLQL